MKKISKNIIYDARLHADDCAVLSSIDEILNDLRTGKPVIIVDDENRENEGDLIVAAECATSEVINFLAREGRGLICLPMESAMIARLGLEMMGRGDNKYHRTAFTVSIEAKEGVTTGISAADRAQTVKVAIDPKSGPENIATPGHVFPLAARDGGVLVRAGHTEAAVDLARLAGFSGAGVLCEIMNDDGTMARLPDLVAYAQKHNLKIGTIADLISYRRVNETLVEKLIEQGFSSVYGGEFKFNLYKDRITGAEHIALVKGSVKGVDAPVLVRMHAVDIMSDVLGIKGDSSIQKAMTMIGAEGTGVLVLLREAGADALSRRLKGEAAPSSAAPLKDYGIGAQILSDLGVRKMTLITDHPKNIVGLEGYNLQVCGHRPLSKA